MRRAAFHCRLLGDARIGPCPADAHPDPVLRLVGRTQDWRLLASSRLGRTINLIEKKIHEMRTLGDR
jgi:hypothetical protein